MLKWCESKDDVDYKNLNYKPVEMSKCKMVRASIQTEEFISVHGMMMRGSLQDVFFGTIERKSELDDYSNCIDLAWLDSIVKHDERFEAWVMLETDESTVYFFCTVITCGGGELQLRIAQTNHRDLLSVNVVKK